MQRCPQGMIATAARASMQTEQSAAATCTNSCCKAPQTLGPVSEDVDSLLVGGGSDNDRTARPRLRWGACAALGAMARCCSNNCRVLGAVSEDGTVLGAVPAVD